MADLTQYQETTLLAFWQYLDEQGIPPTIEELSIVMDRSFGGTRKWLLQLVEKGLMVHEPGRVRSHRITADGRRELKNLKDRKRRSKQKE